MARPREVEDLYPLSPMQQGLLFHAFEGEGSRLYLEQFRWTLEQDVDAAAFETAWQRVVDRHPALRTSFAWEGLDEPLQIVHREVLVRLQVHDWSGLPEAEQQRREEALCEAEQRRGFDLEQAPLLRLALVRLGPQRHLMVCTHHHLLLDGWSLPLVLGDVATAYQAARAGEAPVWPRAVPYRDYIAWLQRQDTARAEEFWRAALSGWRPSPLPGVDRPSTEREADDVEIRLPAARTDALRAAAARCQVTLNTVIQGAWSLLLHRYTGEDDVLFGAVVAGRPASLEGSGSIVGLLINTLPMRVRIEHRTTLEAWLRGLQAAQAEAGQHDFLPLSRIQALSEVPRGERLFESLVAFQNYPASGTIGREKGGLRLRNLRFVERTGYPLTVLVGGSAELIVRISYERARFARRDVERMLAHLEVLLDAMAGSGERRLEDLPILTAEEERELVLAGGEASGAGAGLPHRRFEERARETPDAPAVRLGDAGLTYRELDVRANRLAQRLRRLGAGPEMPVALLLERSVDMVVAILAVAKAGAAYVPIDPAYPQERIAFVVEDCRAPLLVTHSDLAGALPGFAGQAVWMDDPGLAAEPGEAPAGAGDPDGVAYILYTSGSTGRPKGVLVTHRNVVRLLDATQPWFGFGADDVWTLLHSYAFDFSVWEMWGALLHGGTLIVVPLWVSRSPEALHKLLCDHGVTVLNQTPSAFRQLQEVEVRQGPSAKLRLRCVVFGGEALDPRSLVPWMELHGAGAPRFVNMYGITETTVHVTYRPIDLEAARAAIASPIGVPIPDLGIHLLDALGRPVPAGVPGEICVGGAGVARGYWNRPALTAERFVPDAWSRVPGARLYRSGDLGRRLPGGELEYLGRIDHQVKIRGYRIEVGEVEAVLSEHPAVLAAAVQAREDEPGSRQLVAYAVPREPETVTVNELRRFLGDRLPEHMMPAAFVFLEALPLMPSGKLDRRALPAPGRSRPQLEEVYAPPRTPVEEELAASFAEVLGLDRVGIDDSFFALGGDSMKSIQVLARAQARGLQLSVEEIFRHPTIAALSPHARVVEPAALRAARKAPFSLAGEIDRRRLPADVEDAYPLTMMQKGMLFHSHYTDESTTYHDVFSYHLGAPLDSVALHEAVRRLAARHPVLRTSFDLTGHGEPLQLVHREAEVEIREQDLSGMSPEEQERAVDAGILEEAGRRFDWSVAPLLRIHLHRRGEASFQLTLTFHHAILDGWSVASLLAELARIYPALCQGKEPVLEPAPAVTFRDYVALELEAVRSLEAEGYWQGVLGDLPATRLPRLLDPEDQPVQRSSPLIQVHLPQGFHDDFRRFSRSLRVPLKTALLAAHLRVLCFLTGDDAVLTGLGVNGRPETSDGERILGVLINVVPFCARLRGGTWAELVQETFESERAMMPHRRYPMVQMQRMMGGRQLFEAAFDFTHFHVLQPALGRKDLRFLGRGFFQETNYALVAHFDVSPEPSALSLGLEHDLSEITAEQAAAIGGYYARVLAAMVRDPFARYEDVPLLSGAEQAAVLAEPAPRPAAEPGFEVFTELFAARAEAFGDDPALVFAGGEIRYGEIAAEVDRLARRLRAVGVGPDVPVGLMTERSPERVVGMLGILAAGGAFLPLDPAYPRQRLVYMLEDARVRIVVTQSSLRGAAAGLLPEGGLLPLCVDAGETEPATAGTVEPGVAPDSLAYVIYTSGSTGRPKGVQLTHRGLCRVAEEIGRRFGVGPGDRMLQLASPGFDASVFETVFALGNGAALCLGDGAPLLPGPDLVDLLHRDRITHLLLTPSAWTVLPEAFLPDLRTLISAGEALPRDVVDRWAPERRFFNAYGPTETTIWATLAECAPGRRVTIGRAIGHAGAFVLSDRLQPVPTGTPGELCIGGAALARGYLGRPDLTAERFVPDPFSERPGARLYRTGDRARRRADGELEFLGRLDQQVKVRGVRIELGEVEGVLREHPMLRDAAAVVREDGPAEHQIVAYVVPAPQTAQVEELAHWQGERVAEWQSIYEDIYRSAEPAGDATFNIVGWQSSYTGEALPEDQMREWVDRTVERIAGLDPRRILEMGCGTGLLLFRLAPRCDLYVGADFSHGALRSVEGELSRPGRELPQVRLEQRSADDFAGLPRRGFDGVVLNSVVQYFPSVDYLLRVLDGAVEAVADGGFVFLGDLRSLPLLEAFHASVELARDADLAPVDPFFRRVQQRILQEQELVLDPALFAGLQRRLPRVSGVEVLLKRGRSDNELTRFRYDVVLHVGQELAVEDGRWLPWQEEEWSVSSLWRTLIESRPQRLGLLGVPNSRVLEPLRLAELATTAQHGPATVGELREKAREAARGAVDPEEVWDLGEDLGYEVEIGWSEAAGCFDAWLRRTGARDAGLAPLQHLPARPRAWRSYANNPLQGRMAHRLLPELRSWLEGCLPESMLPSAFVVLDELPRTPAGKLDRAALPAPDWGRPEQQDRFTAPRTPVEQQLAAIWSEVLRVERVGIHDNFFFELGGDSILSIQVVARANEAGLRLTPKQIFDHQTVAALAAQLEERDEEPEPPAPARGPAAAPQPAGAGPAEPGSFLPQIVLDAARRFEPFPLSEVQEVYWAGGSGLYDLGTSGTNVYMMFEATGPVRPILDRFHDSLARLIERHDTLRTVILPDVRQRVLDWVPRYEMPVEDLRGRSEEEIRAEALRMRRELCSRRGDIERWPLFEMRAHRVADERLYIHMRISSLLIDGESRNLFVQELMDLFLDPARELAPLDCTYRDYVVAWRGFRDSPLYRRAAEYWLRRVPELPPAPELPLAAAPDPATPSEFVHRTATFLEADVWKRFKGRLADAGLTPATVVTTAFVEVLSRYARNPSFTIGMVGSYRPPLHPRIHEVLGNFNTLTLLAVDQPSGSFEERARRTQDQLSRDLEHRYFSGLRLIRELNKARGLSSRARIPVWFNSVIHLGDDSHRRELGRRSVTTDVGTLRMTEATFIASQSMLMPMIGESMEGALRCSWQAVDRVFPEGLMDEMLGELRARVQRLNDVPESWSEGMPERIPEARWPGVEIARATRPAFPSSGPAEPARLADVWEEVLGVRPASSADDFFALGGDSLAAVRLADRVRQVFGLALPLPALFQGSFASMAAVLADPVPKPEPEARGTVLPLPDRSEGEELDEQSLA